MVNGFRKPFIYYAEFLSFRGQTGENLIQFGFAIRHQTKEYSPEMKHNADCQILCVFFDLSFLLVGIGGKYYMYATHVDGVQLYVSSDKLNWDFAGFCFTREEYKEFWAPAVAQIGGKYYLYVSCMPSDTADDHTQRLITAVSETPQGPFRYCCDLVPPFSIDAHVVQSGGEWFLFYSVNDYTAECAGTLIVVDKMLSPTQVC